MDAALCRINRIIELPRHSTGAFFTKQFTGNRVRFLNIRFNVTTLYSTLERHTWIGFRGRMAF